MTPRGLAAFARLGNSDGGGQANPRREQEKRVRQSAQRGKKEMWMMMMAAGVALEKGSDRSARATYGHHRDQSRRGTQCLQHAVVFERQLAVEWQQGTLTWADSLYLKLPLLPMMSASDREGH